MALKPEYGEFERRDLSTWANCATPDCPNKACTWSLRPELCHPCGVYVLGEPAMEARWAETHTDDDDDVFDDTHSGGVNE